MKNSLLFDAAKEACRHPFPLFSKRIVSRDDECGNIEKEEVITYGPSLIALLVIGTGVAVGMAISFIKEKRGN